MLLKWALLVATKEALTGKTFAGDNIHCDVQRPEDAEKIYLETDKNGHIFINVGDFDAKVTGRNWHDAENLTCDLVFGLVLPPSQMQIEENIIDTRKGLDIAFAMTVCQAEIVKTLTISEDKWSLFWRDLVFEFKRFADSGEIVPIKGKKDIPLVGTVMSFTLTTLLPPRFGVPLNPFWERFYELLGEDSVYENYRNTFKSLFELPDGGPAFSLAKRIEVDFDLPTGVGALVSNG